MHLTTDRFQTEICQDITKTIGFVTPTSSKAGDAPPGDWGRSGWRFYRELLGS